MYSPLNNSLVLPFPQLSHFNAHAMPQPYFHVSRSQSSHTFTVVDFCARQSALACCGPAVLVETFNPGSPELYGITFDSFVLLSGAGRMGGR